VYKYYCLSWPVKVNITVIVSLRGPFQKTNILYCFSVRSVSIEKHYFSCLSMWFIPRCIALSIFDTVHFRKSIISPSRLVCSLFSWNNHNHPKLCHFTTAHAYLLPAKSEYTTPGYVTEFILNTLPINQQSKLQDLT
jgi:hypothetical protein